MSIPRSQHVIACVCRAYISFRRCRQLNRFMVCQTINDFTKEKRNRLTWNDNNINAVHIRQLRFMDGSSSRQTDMPMNGLLQPRFVGVRIEKLFAALQCGTAEVCPESILVWKALDLVDQPLSYLQFTNIQHSWYKLQFNTVNKTFTYWIGTQKSSKDMGVTDLTSTRPRISLLRIYWTLLRPYWRSLQLC